MKPEGDSCHEQSDNGSPDMVCKCIDGESCKAAPIDDGQDCKNPKGDSGRIDGGDEEECSDACKDAECRVNSMRHI